MPHPDILIIANPIAGRGRAEKLAKEFQAELERHQVTAVIAWTRGVGHAEVLARDAVRHRMNCIGVCGGDGTVYEVVNALAGSEVAMVLIPGGRCNDLARALRIPVSPKQLAVAIAHMKTRPIDLGRVGDRFFATVATLGFDAEVTRMVAENQVPFSGMPAYVFAALQLMFKYEFQAVHIDADFGQYDGKVLLAATANTSAYGGGMKIAPLAKLDDGWLDVCLIRKAPRMAILGLFPTVFTGYHTVHSAVTLHRTRWMQVVSSQPLWVYADGEPVCTTPVTVSIEHHALQVVTPFP